MQSVLFANQQKMPSIGVLEHNQKPTDRPSRRIKKAGGQSLVNRGLAYWLKENVLLQMIDSPKTEHRFTPAAEIDSPRRYIPAKLPANIDYQLGLVVCIPALANQVRFRPIADQRSNPAY